MALFELHGNDRVRVNDTCTMSWIIGEVGTVMTVADGSIGVAFDNYVSGHDLDGLADDGHGWYLNPSSLDHDVDIPDIDIPDDVELL